MRMGGIIKHKTDTETTVSEVNKLMDSDKPEDRQKAIDKTIEHFRINTADIKSVKNDPSLVGDGQASSDGRIKIGPKAFKSYGWPSSTLGHEIEVHFQQQAKHGNW
jgi:hypothetical protein